MILQTHNYDATVVATVQVKEANLTTSEQFKHEMLALIDDGHQYIVVNLEHVVYVDSSFLGALVAALKYALGKKAEIVVAGLNKDIAALFQLIRLDKAFKIFANAEEAVTKKA